MNPQNHIDLKGGPSEVLDGKTNSYMIIDMMVILLLQFHITYMPQKVAKG